MKTGVQPRKMVTELYYKKRVQSSFCKAAPSGFSTWTCSEASSHLLVSIHHFHHFHNFPNWSINIWFLFTEGFLNCAVQLNEICGDLGTQRFGSWHPQKARHGVLAKMDVTCGRTDLEVPPNGWFMKGNTYWHGGGTFNSGNLHLTRVWMGLGYQRNRMVIVVRSAPILAPLLQLAMNFRILVVRKSKKLEADKIPLK